MKNYKIYLGIFFIFLLGIVIGSLSTAIYIKHIIQKVMEGNNTTIDQFVITKLNNELKLTESQREEVTKIVKQATSDIYLIRKRNQPEIERVIEQSIALIKEKLNAEQNNKLDVMYQKFKERWKLK